MAYKWNKYIAETYYFIIPAKTKIGRKTSVSCVSCVYTIINLSFITEAEWFYSWVPFQINMLGHSRWMVIWKGCRAILSQIAVNKSITDPDKAFSLILKDYHSNKKLLPNLRNLNMYKGSIFLTYPTTLKNIIPIVNCDTTALYDILSSISAFPTSAEKYRKILVCKNIMVKHHGVVCCQICMTCMNCQGTVPCCSINLRNALKFLKDFRNMGAHINIDICRNIKLGNYPIPISNCNSWIDVLNGFKLQSKIVLNIIKNENIITLDEYEERKTNISIVLRHDSNIYFKIYSNAMTNLRTKNWTVPTLEKVHRSLEIMLDRNRKNSWYAGCVKWFSDINVTRPDLAVIKKISTAFVDKSIKLLNEEIGLKINNHDNINIFCCRHKPMPAASRDLLPVTVKFNITFCNGTDLPNCYEDIFSNESDQLRQYIQQCLENAIKAELKTDILVDCVDWEIGSVHITYEIFKEHCEWNANERELIEDIITKMDICLTEHPLCSSFTTCFPAEIEEDHFESYIFTIWVLDEKLVAPISSAIPKIKLALEKLTLCQLMTDTVDDGEGKWPLIFNLM